MTMPGAARRGGQTARPALAAGRGVAQSTDQIRRDGWSESFWECASTAWVRVLVGALLSGLVFRFGADPALPAFGFVALIGVALARIDIATRRLPFALTVPTFVATFVLLTPAAVVDGWYPMDRGVIS